MALLKETVLKRLPAQIRNRISSLDGSPIVKRFATGAFWSAIASAISRLLLLITSIFLARLLGKEAFGALGIIQSTIATFQLFAGFGFGVTATKFVAEYRQKDPVKARRFIALSTVSSLVSGGLVSGIVFLSSGWLATHTLRSPSLSSLLRITSIMLLFSALNGAQMGALSGLERFSSIARLNLATGIISLALILTAGYFRGLLGIVWALAISAIFTAALSHRTLAKEIITSGLPRKSSGFHAERSVLWRFSIPAILAGASVVPVNWICNAMLVRGNDGLSQMGIFNAANQWFSALIFLPIVLEQVTLPMISERLGANDGAWTRRLLMLSMKVNALLVFPFLLIASLASPFIMRLYGTAFADSWPTLVLILITASLFSVQAPVGQLLAAAGRMWTGFWMNTAWAFVMIVSTKLFIHRGALGLAAARLLAYALHSVWVFIYAYFFIVKSPIVTAQALAEEAAADIIQVG